MVTYRSSSRPHAHVAAALSVAVSIAVSLLALETGLRLWDGIPVFSGENFAAQRVDLIRANAGPIVHDELLGWRLSDNYSGGDIVTGEFGIRMNSNDVTPIPRGGILAVGDSFTVGSEVGNAESYPAHLEGLLGSPVLNAGSGGWGVDQITLRAEQLIPILEPTALIAGILDQDIRRNNYRVFGGGYKPYFSIEDGALVLQGTPVPQFEHSPTNPGLWRTVLGHSYLVDWLIERAGLVPQWIDDQHRYDLVGDDGPEISGLLMKRLGELGRRQGIRVVVLLYGGDAIVRGSPPGWVTPTVDGARAGGAAVVDMFPILKKIHDEDPERLKQLYVMHDAGTFGHMSSDGNLLVAQSIRDVLAKPD